MIGRVTNIGTIDYTASYDGERLYLYEQSKLVAEREMKDLTGVVFDGNVIYYTTSGNNTIFAETVLGHALKSYALKEYEEAAVYKKLSDTEFVIAAANEDDVRIVIHNVTEGTVTLELPCDSFHDFVYDGEDGFRISGHRNVNISIYEDDCDYEDIEYSEYEIGSSGELSEKCHFGVCEIENSDEFVSRPDSKNIVFSLFDNYLEYYFYPRILTPSFIVAKCEHTKGFIVFEKNTGALKMIISLDEDLFEDIEMYGFNEQTNVLTIWGGSELHRFKVTVSDEAAVRELHNRYMTAYEANIRSSLRKNFEFEKLFFKAVDSCKVSEIKY